MKSWTHSLSRFQPRRPVLVGAALMLAFTPMPALGQIGVNFDSGSTGLDLALRPLTDLVIDMTDHPDGVYNYTSVDIPPGITVSFTPNDANTPVTWLVRDTCTIDGTLTVSGVGGSGPAPGRGGPGGFRGGDGGSDFGPNFAGGAGLGPGGGAPSISGSGVHGSAGGSASSSTNVFLQPLVGGSGAGGGNGASGFFGGGGGGGGGAILIAVTDALTINGTISAPGGAAGGGFRNGGIGGAGAIRLVAQTLSGSGSVSSGLNRIEVFDRTNWTGSFSPVPTQDLPGILLVPAATLPSLTFMTIAGQAVPALPSGDTNSPDITIPSSQANPIAIEVACTNIPEGTDITVTAKSTSGAVASDTKPNVGTFASSTAMLDVNLLPGFGVIEATATSSITAKSRVAAVQTQEPSAPGQPVSLLETGLAPNGERFSAVEVTAALGGGQRIVFVTGSGARFPLPADIKL